MAGLEAVLRRERSLAAVDSAFLRGTTDGFFEPVMIQ